VTLPEQPTCDRETQPWVLYLPTWVVLLIDEARLPAETLEDFASRVLGVPVMIVDVRPLDDHVSVDLSDVAPQLGSRDVLFATVMSRLGFRPLKTDGSPEALLSWADRLLADGWTPGDST
jgi:hypothetical protein